MKLIHAIFNYIISDIYNLVLSAEYHLALYVTLLYIMGRRPIYTNKLMLCYVVAW